MQPRSVFSSYEYTPVAGFGADADATSCMQGQVMYPTGQCGPAVNIGTPCPPGMTEPFPGANFCLGPGVAVPNLSQWGIPTQTTPGTPLSIPETPIQPSGTTIPIPMPDVVVQPQSPPVNVTVAPAAENDDWVVPVMVAGAGLIALAAIFSTRR